MKQFLYLIALVSIVTMFIGCSPKQPQVAEKSTLEKRMNNCPWCMNEPEIEGEYMHFVGISKVYAAEQGARTDARKNATQSVVMYRGSAMKVKMEEARVSHGLSSDAIDPVGVTREFQKLLSQSIVNRLKSIKWYVEKEKTTTGEGYKYFVLSKIAKSSLDNPYKEFANQKKKEAEEKARDQKLGDQAAKAAKMWGDLLKQGVTD